MGSIRSHWDRHIGETVFFALLGLIVVAALRKGPWPSDFVYVLVRWPVWLVVCVGGPLLAVRLLLWGRSRRG